MPVVTDTLSSKQYEIMNKIYKIDKDTLEIKSGINYKRPFYIMLAVNIGIVASAMTTDPEIINKIKIIKKTDTIIVKDKDIALTDSAITAELVKLGCVLPNVAVAQFKIETGHYTSAICRENKNLAGIRNSASPLSIGKNRGHNVYKTYKDCLRDYVRVQNKYLKNIDGKYAEAKGYINQIRIVK
jgi:uncharacterized FlgJ-related protein